MAITIHQQPGKYTPAYNEHMFVCTSSNVAQPNFKYIVDIYDAATNTLLVELKQPLNPANGYLVVDVHRIIESYLSYDFTPGQYGFLQNTNSYKGYYIWFGEEYGTALVDHLNVTQSNTIYAINTALPWRDYATYNGNTAPIANLWATGGQFLTTPTAFNIGLSQSFFLHFINNGTTNNTNAPTLVIHTYNAGGTVQGVYQASNPYSDVSTVANNYLRVSVGTQDMDNISGITSVYHTLPVITPQVAYYTVYMQSTNGSPSSPVITFNIVTECRYDIVRLHFLNKYGGFDAFNFNKINKETVTTTRQSYKQPYGALTGTTWGYKTTDRQTIPFDTRYNSTMHLCSDWLQDADIQWLRELVSSPVVFHEASPGVFYAVNITDAPYTINKKNFQQVFNLEIDISYSEDNYRQRQ